jgi:uncharacterized OB-fold protein
MPNQIPIVEYLALAPEPHLVSKECTNCGALYFDRRNACARCSGTEFGARDLAQTGTVRAFTVIHRGAPGARTPFTSAIVDLDGGGAVKANLVGVDDDPARIGLGMSVQLTTFTAGTDDDGTEAVAFAFEPKGS